MAIGASNTLRTIEDLSALEQLAGPWETLAEKQHSRPIDRSLWSLAAARAFKDEYSLSVRVLGDGEHAQVIAPLARRKGHYFRLEILGMAELSEPGDFVAEDPDALEMLLRELLDEGSPLFLKRVPADSLTVALLGRMCRRRDLFVVRPAGATPWLPLDDGIEDPEARLSAKRRSDLRRFRKRAQAEGKVELAVRSPTVAELGPLLEEALSIEDHSWKGRAGSSVLKDSHRGAFFHNYARAAARAGSLRIALLHIGGAPAAMQIAVEDHDRLSLLKIGYDERFQSCSPGTLLMLEAIRYASQHGLSGVDFLGSEAPWTRMWTEQSRPCVAVRVYPLGLKSAAALAEEAAEHGWAELSERVR
ncbi:MAG: GNAT family N-acetyltransferase [Myxococcota bacterium]